jgi:hypothetical protein
MRFIMCGRINTSSVRGKPPLMGCARAESGLGNPRTDLMMKGATRLSTAPLDPRRRAGQRARSAVFLGQFGILIGPVDCGRRGW